MEDSEVFVSADCTRQLPLSSLADSDLCVNPCLANLVTKLKKCIDPSGMSIALAQPLDNARKMMQVQRAKWLKWATLYRFLQEVLLKLGNDPSLPDQNFLKTLDQQLLVVELKRMLIIPLFKKNPRRFVLSLETQDFNQLLPPHQDLEEMQKRLPAKMDKLLKANCLQLLSYYHPNTEDIGAAAKMITFASLAEHLAIEKQQLKKARAQKEQLNGYLDQQKEVYSQILLRCLGLLKKLICKFRLGIQSDLDKVYVQYMEIKTSAMLLKMRIEEMKILLKAYTPEIVNVHQVIRDELQGNLSKEKTDLVTFRSILSEYEILGPEFKELVEQYTTLHEMIQNRRWMLAELEKN